jgi:crotonobetainyl-CoA:carnitine CoA-transferase CaiB-like acyl-CoA transferase
MADWMTVPLLHQVYGGKAPERVGLAHPSIAPYGSYGTADGEVVLSIQNQREWRNFCAEVLEQPGLAKDARFHDNTARVANRAALDTEIDAVFARLIRAALIERLHRGGIAYGAVNTVADLAHHPQLRRLTAKSPSGAVELVAPPARFAGETPDARPIPALDQHGAAIRAEFAG